MLFYPQGEHKIRTPTKKRRMCAFIRAADRGEMRLSYG
jgi:hypothetical protein